jgi:hypothetical protein
MEMIIEGRTKYQKDLAKAKKTADKKQEIVVKPPKNYELINHETSREYLSKWFELKELNYFMLHALRRMQKENMNNFSLIDLMENTEVYKDFKERIT